MNAVVRTAAVTKAFGRDAPVLRQVSLEVGQGQMAALVGRSGSGKSTLLYLLAGLIDPDDGVVEFEGKPWASMTRVARTTTRLQSIGFVFQFFHLLPSFTALENVELPLRLCGRRTLDRAATLLERVGLRHRAGALPGELSGGERQRVAIARALVLSPKLILADEPTGNLDRMTAEAILDLLIETADQENAALVIATHDPEVAGRFGCCIHVERATAPANVTSRWLDR